MSINKSRLDLDAKSLLKNVDPSQLIGKASSIVLKAANILEENIAEGIIAAQKVEQKIVDVDKLRDQEQHDMMNRFRKDGHEALDILFDAITQASNTVTALVEKVTQLDDVNSNAKRGSYPVLTLDKALAPGSKASLPLMLENESDKDVMRLEFKTEGLSTESEIEIKKRNVTFIPKVLELKPGQKGEVQINIYIPKTTAPGLFSGLIKEKSLSGLEAMLQIEVQ